MWTTHKPYYSEKNILMMLKKASTEKLVEVLMMTREKKDDQ